MTKTVDTNKIDEIVKEIFWQAWQACGRPKGMGFLQDKPDASRDDVFENVVGAGDYGVNLRGSEKDSFYGDYVFGRMMKLSVKLNRKDGEIILPDSEPSWDYQSWSSKFPSYEALLDAAIEKVQ